MNDRYPNLRYTLATRDGFENSITYTSVWEAVMMLSGLGALFAWLFNLAGTIRGMMRDDVPFRYFLDVFFYEDGIWTVFIWAPAVLLPLAIGAFIAKKMTTSSDITKVYERYMSSGCLATTYATGITLNPSKDMQTTLVVYAHPSVPEETIVNFIAYLRGPMQADPKSPTYMEWAAKLKQVGSDIKKATPAQSLDYSYPAGVWLVQALPALCGSLGITPIAPAPIGTRPVVLVPNGTNAADVHVLKENVVVS